MNLSDYVSHDATSLAQLVKLGEVTAAELAGLARQAFEKVDPAINAVVEFYDDAETVPGPADGAFNGVPFLRKEVLRKKGACRNAAAGC